MLKQKLKMSIYVLFLYFMTVYNYQKTIIHLYLKYEIKT